MISSMSSQVAELKAILSTSSRLSSTFRPIARVDIASSNSDTSSTDSDFTFPAPVSNTEPLSSPESNSFQLVVQDVTAGDGSGQSNFLPKFQCTNYLPIKLAYCLWEKIIWQSEGVMPIQRSCHVYCKCNFINKNRSTLFETLQPVIWGLQWNIKDKVVVVAQYDLVASYNNAIICIQDDSNSNCNKIIVRTWLMFGFSCLNCPLVMYEKTEMRHV